MDDLHRQAKALGLGALTAMADIINTTLGAMTGAISPRMRLELLAARLLAGSESGFATAAPAPASSGMPPAAASSTSTTSAASGTGASGFAGASRGGFAGASHGGFSGAARNQQAAAPQSTASHESVGGNGPVSDRPADSPSVQPAVATAAAGAGWGAPAASPAVPAQPVTSPAASDNRSIDEKWDAAVAALPETIREYVSRDKVPTVKFGPNRKGLPCLSMTFDKSLSQHAFALAVDNSGKKAAVVVMDAVRNEFGANAVIAPSAVAANGERVESVKRMSPEQLAKVKQQIAMAKAGLAASSLGAGLGIHMGSEPKAPKPTETGRAEDTDDSHRAGQSSASTAAKNWSDDDPWAKPAVSNASPQSADGFAPNEPAATPAPEEHHKKHVAVPDISDGVDPWAAPAAPVAPTASVASAGPTGQSTGQHLLLRQLPARATIHGIRRSLRPRSHRRRNRPKPTRGTSHISSLLTMIRGISRRGTMLRRLHSQETTRGISLSPRLRLLRFLRQCRAICRAMTRGISPNRFRSRLPAMTRGINRRQFHNRLRRPPRTVTRGINRNPHSRPRMPTRGIASPSPSRNHNRKSRPRMTNTR